MNIEINITNKSKLQHLVELLKSLDFVESVKVQPENVDLSITKEKKSQFDKFYGSTKSNKTVKQIDDELNHVRNEWERAI